MPTTPSFGSSDRLRCAPARQKKRMKSSGIISLSGSVARLTKLSRRVFVRTNPAAMLVRIRGSPKYRETPVATRTVPNAMMSVSRPARRLRTRRQKTKPSTVPMRRLPAISSDGPFIAAITLPCADTAPSVFPSRMRLARAAANPKMRIANPSSNPTTA